MDQYDASPRGEKGRADEVSSPRGKKTRHQPHSEEGLEELAIAVMCDPRSELGCSRSYRENIVAKIMNER